MGSLRSVRPSRTYWFSQLSYLMQFCRDGSEVQSPRHLSLHRSHAPAAPPSLLRVPLGSVPRTHWYYEALRLPAIRPGGLVDSPVGTGPHSSLRSLPWRVLPRKGQGFGLPVPSTGGFWLGDGRVSQVPGGPSIACPASSKLRRTRGARPIRHQRCCLPTPDTGSASTKSDFGAIHTAYDLAVYASPLRLPPRRKTRFRLAATLGRTGLSPARSDRKVSETPLSSTDLRHLFPLPQA